MSSPDRLIEELRGGASEVVAGQFTIDRTQARLKLRRFQLADPRRYPVFLVEAAVLRGAARAEFRIDADDVVCGFDGTPLTAFDFDELYASLFVRGEDDPTRARRALAVGLNAAMALRPRWIRIDTGDGEAAVRFELRPDRPDAIVPAPEPVAGTRIHVKSRLRSGLATAFRRVLGGAVAEERWLRDACRFARIAVFVNGTRVSFDGEDPLLTRGLARHAVEGPGSTGLASFDPQHEEESRVALLCSGVLVCWQRVDHPPHCVGVVESPDFRRDASQADVLRDEAFARALEAWTEAAEKAVVECCGRVSWAEPGPVAERCRRAVRAALRRRRDRYVARWSSGEPLDDLSAALARAPIWRTVRGEPAAPAAALDEAAAGGMVSYTPLHFDELPEEAGRGVLELTDEADLELLSSLFPGRRRNVTAALQEAQAREQARRKFLSRTAEPGLPPSDRFLAVEPVRGEGVSGEAAVGGSFPGGWIRFVRDGCLLAEKRIELPFAGGRERLPVEAVLAGPFRPNERWDDVRPDDVLARAVVALLEAVHRAVRRLCLDAPAAAPDFRRKAVLAWLWGVSDPDGLGRAWAAFGIDPDEIDPATAARAAEAQPRLGVGRDRAAAGEPHPAARVPLIARAGGPPVDLATIDAEVRTHGQVACLVDEPETAMPTESGPVLLVSADEKTLLERIFGADALRDVTEEWRTRRRAEAFEAREAEAIGPDPRAWTAVPFGGPGFQGWLSLLRQPAVPAVADASPGPWAGTLCLPDGRVVSAVTSAWPVMPLRILRRGRPLGERAVPAVTSTLAAVVDGTEVRANAGWTDVEDPEFEARATAAAAAAFVSLAARLAADFSSLAEPELRLAGTVLLDALCAPFPSPAFAAAWRTVRRTLPFDRTRAVWVRLLDVTVGWNPKVVGAAEWVDATVAEGVKEAEGDADRLEGLGDRVVERAVAAGILASPAEPPGRAAWKAWLDECVDDPAWPMPAWLGSLVLFRSLAGRAVTPAELALHLATDGRIGWVDPGAPPDEDGASPTLRLQEKARARLLRSLGPRALEDRTEETVRRRRFRRVESVPRLERVAPAPHEVLETVPLTAGGVRGEVGFAAEPDAGPSRLTVCLDHRPVAQYEGFSRFVLRAVVNDDNLRLMEGGTEPLPEERDRLARLCEAAIPALVGRLCARRPGYDPDRQAAAWRHLLDVLAADPTKTAAAVHRGKPAYLREAAEAPGFRLLSGDRRTTVDLFEQAERLGGLFLVRAGDPAPPARGIEPSVLLLVEPWEEERIRRLFRKVFVWGECAPELRREVRFRAGLRPLPDLQGIATQVELEFRRRGLAGRIFLPADDAVPLEVSFACGEWEVARGALSPLLPCAGLVRLPPGAMQIVAASGWEVAAAELRVASVGEPYVVRLYALLAEQAASSKDERALDRLADAALRLQRATATARRRLAGPAGTLLRDLRQRPLIRRGDRRVRLDRLLRRRPADLEPLGLWRPRTVPQEAPSTGSKPPATAPPSPADAPPAPSPVPTQEGSPMEAPPSDRSPTRSPSDAAPAAETPEAREARFLDRLADTWRRVWPKGLGPAPGRKSFAMVDRDPDLPARYAPELVTVERRHPLVRAALATFDEDPVALWLLVSTLATQANLDFTRITDDHERSMQFALVELLTADSGPDDG